MDQIKWKADEKRHRELLRARYRGDWGTEAAVELLLRHDRFGNHDRVWIKRDAVYLEGHGEVDECPYVDWEMLVERGAFGPYSSTERRVMAVAASIAGQHVDDFTLDWATTAQERRNMTLILAALSHATGQHRLPGGALVSWPAEES